MSQNDEDTSKKLEKTRRPPYVPPVSIPDTVVVPDNTILLVPDQLEFANPTCYEKCTSKRSWFSSYFYNCLPIVFGNQHGFLLKSTNSFVCRWDGTDANDGVSVHFLDSKSRDDLIIESHFGHGILTVQTRQYFRTPKGVNMMVKAPPNYFVHGMSWMDAVVETDNLRRDFTFNIRITRPQMDIYIAKGTPLGCFLPYPRFFLDKYELAPLTDEVELQNAIQTAQNYAIERDQYDGEKPRLRYMEGRDIYDTFYDQHQKSLDSGQWWSSPDAKVERRLMQQQAGAEKQVSQSQAAKPDAAKPDAATSADQPNSQQSSQPIMQCPVTHKRFEQQPEKNDEEQK